MLSSDAQYNEVAQQLKLAGSDTFWVLKCLPIEDAVVCGRL